MKPLLTRQRRLIADFYAAHRTELVCYATARLGNREESEDLVQDVFVKLMTLEDMIRESTMKSFAFTVTSNKIKDVLRRRIFRRQAEEGKACEMQLQHSNAEHMAEYHETLATVYRSIERLSPACAKVYRMSFFDDMAAGDIAHRLNVSKRTVEAQLFASRKQIRQMVREAM